MWSSVYAEHIVREAAVNEDEGENKIDDRKIDDLRYADDTTLLADKPEALKRLVKKLKEESVRTVFQLSLKKTKVMTTGTINNFTTDNEEIETIQNFTFLGSTINKKEGCTHGIGRLILARTAMKE